MRQIISTVFLVILALTQGVSAQTTLEWWQFWTDPDIKPTINAMVEEFQRQNPDIRVNVTDLTWANGNEKIAIAFSSGTAPDVVELGSDWIAQFASTGQLADLTTHLDSQKLAYQGWSMARYNDRLYAKPWILGTRVLFLNRTLLNKAGFEKDFTPLRWEELQDAAQKVRALGPNIYGWGSNTAETHRLYKKFMPFFWSARCRIFSDDDKYCVISSQKAVDVLKFYKNLNDCCGYVADQRGIEDAFLDGKIGIIMSGDWLLKRIELEKRNINFATALMPGPDPAFGTGRMFVAGLGTSAYPGKSFEGGEFLAVSAKSAQPAAAVKLIDFITSPENQLKFCKANRSTNPSSRAAQEDPYFQSDPNLRTFVMQMNLSEHPPVVPYWVNIEAEIEKAVEKVVFENAPPGETLRALRQTITDIRKK
jgi:multiple sugar transport system substrate-binding protein